MIGQMASVDRWRTFDERVKLAPQRREFANA